MVAEPQRSCFERAERPSVVNGDSVLLRITDAFSLSPRLAARPLLSAKVSEAVWYVTSG